jgi:hypothetical protein
MSDKQLLFSDTLAQVTTFWFLLCSAGLRAGASSKAKAFCKFYLTGVAAEEEFYRLMSRKQKGMEWSDLEKEKSSGRGQALGPGG